MPDPDLVRRADVLRAIKAARTLPLSGHRRQDLEVREAFASFNLARLAQHLTGSVLALPAHKPKET